MIPAESPVSREQRDHVVIACPGCGSRGSVASVALRQARELSRCFRVTLLSETLPAEGLPGVALEPVTAPRFDYLRRFSHVPNQLASAYAARRRLAALHRRDPVAFVLCHSHALAALAANPLRLRHGVPYGLVTHGDIFDRPPGTYDRRLTLFYRRVTPPAYRHADLVVALSPHMAECARRGGANPDAVHVVPNGIDPADIGLADEVPDSGTTPERVDSAFRLLNVGRLAPEKGVDTLIEALGILVGRGLRIELRIVGSGPLETALRADVGRRALHDYVTFVGPAPRKALAQHYRWADAVCVPSRSDPLPGVVLEARVCGRPVVAAAVGGIPFLVEDGESGMLVPPDAPGALAQAVHALAADPAKLRRLSENAARSVYPRFSWARIGDEVAALLRAVIRRQRQATAGHATQTLGTRHGEAAP